MGDITRILIFTHAQIYGPQRMCTHTPYTKRQCDMFSLLIPYFIRPKHSLIWLVTFAVFCWPFHCSCYQRSTHVMRCNISMVVMISTHGALLYARHDHYRPCLRHTITLDTQLLHVKLRKITDTSHMWAMRVLAHFAAHAPIMIGCSEYSILLIISILCQYNLCLMFYATSNHRVSLKSTS